jgi:pimeloyl-ACP methyl ester carboxylesterase
MRIFIVERNFIRLYESRIFIIVKLSYMKKILSICFTSCFILTQLINSEINAQEAVSPNGKFATVKGVKIYYEDTGKGMPLILLHGFTGTASVWKPFIPQFSKFYRVIAIDLPGHGRSDYMDTTNVYLHKRAAEYILGVLDKLQIDSADVMGISSGGFITLYMATIRPELTKKIIVIGGQVYYSQKTRNVISSMESSGTPDLFKNLDQVHGKQKASLILRQFWNFKKLYGDPSFTPDVLSTVKASALIIHGDNDPIAPVTNAWEMFQNIPKVNLWIVPNGGHVPNAIPGNQDDFTRRVLEFLRGDWENSK